MITFGFLLMCAGVALAQFQCPPDDGYYGDPNQCDKYYDCYRGDQKETLCPDGLVFDTSVAPKLGQCNYPFIVPCAENTVLQPAIQAGIECPRQNGYFEHEDPTNCDNYYQCTNGLPVNLRCHTGLVFDEYTGSCQWAHSGIRENCVIRAVTLKDGFSCPANETQLASNGHMLDHARYPNLDDCRMFYVCKQGLYPELIGCPEGTVFNDVSLNCDAPENVPGCETYYETIGGQAN